MPDLEFKPLFQPWNEEEFWADVHVQNMPRIAAHLYKALCNAAFFCSTRPYLPTSDEELCMHSRAESMEQWLQYKSVILKMFTRTNVKGKRLLKRERIVQDWEKLLAKRESFLERSKKANEAKRKVTQGALKEPTRSLESPKRSEVREVKRSEGKLREVSEIDFPSANQNEFLEEEQDMSKFDPFVRIWQDKHGEAALCPYPRDSEKFKNKTIWKELISNHGVDLLLQAFTLWAEEQAAEGVTERFPLEKFSRVAGDYMQLIKPLKTTIIREETQKRSEQLATEEYRKLHGGLAQQEEVPVDDKEIF
jgi:hypothetical protein